MTKGFVIMAQNTEKTDYVKCAEALELSIKRVMPDANVTIITTDMLPHGDQAPDSDWKLINDWQVYEASPYDETIKLEADMFLPRSIEHWFDILSINDVTLCTKIRNYKGELSDTRVYRKFIDDNNLPDVYNAITYFKKSDTAEQFYKIVRDVFENWEEYKAILKCNPTEEATTDWVYAIASHIIGVEKTTLPNFNELSMTHMKQFVSGTSTENWTDTLVYELLPDVLRVHTYSQEYPFHYHSKSFSDKILERYKWNTL
jgi:hypothetical protein